MLISFPLDNFSNTAKHTLCVNPGALNGKIILVVLVCSSGPSVLLKYHLFLSLIKYVKLKKAKKYFGEIIKQV
jgi:hypothetical protein